MPGATQEASLLCLSGWAVVTWRGGLESGATAGDPCDSEVLEACAPAPRAPGTLGLPGTEAEVRVPSLQQSPGDQRQVQASAPHLPSRVSTPHPPLPDDLSCLG